jgi:hypothetical protein
MVRISEVINQNPWWKDGADFIQFDQNFREAKAKPVFSRRKEIALNKESTYVLQVLSKLGKPLM